MSIKRFPVTTGWRKSTSIVNEVPLTVYFKTFRYYGVKGSRAIKKNVDKEGSRFVVGGTRQLSRVSIVRRLSRVHLRVGYRPGSDDVEPRMGEETNGTDRTKNKDASRQTNPSPVGNEGQTQVKSRPVPPPSL